MQELCNISSNIYNNGNYLALNSARSCLKYVLRTFGINEIYVPYYTCPVVWQTIKQEACKIKFYHINSDFLPAQNFPKDAYIIYTNYSGICSKNVKKLSCEYKNLIVDNAQAFFMPKYGIASFNSVRKFFPAPDGAFLFSDVIEDTAFEKETASREYEKNSFNSNAVLFDSKNIKLMSDITSDVIKNTDIDEVKQKRLLNFNLLNSELENYNPIKFKADDDDVPMFYPYYSTNQKLERIILSEGLKAERFWNPYPDTTQEGLFQRHILYLSVDQKQTESDISKLINIIKKNR